MAVRVREQRTRRRIKTKSRLRALTKTTTRPGGRDLNMDTSVVNALDFGIREGQGKGKENIAALSRAIDEAETSGALSIVIPEGTYEIDGTLKVAVSAISQQTPTLRVSGLGRATLVQSGDCAAPAIVVDTAGAGRFQNVVLDGLCFEGNLGAPNLDGVTLDGGCASCP